MILSGLVCQAVFGMQAKARIPLGLITLEPGAVASRKATKDGPPKTLVSGSLLYVGEYVRVEKGTAKIIHRIDKSRPEIPFAPRVFVPLLRPSSIDQERLQELEALSRIGGRTRATPASEEILAPLNSSRFAPSLLEVRWSESFPVQLLKVRELGSNSEVDALPPTFRPPEEELAKLYGRKITFEFVLQDGSSRTVSATGLSRTREKEFLAKLDRIQGDARRDSLGKSFATMLLYRSYGLAAEEAVELNRLLETHPDSELFARRLLSLYEKTGLIESSMAKKLIQKFGPNPL